MDLDSVLIFQYFNRSRAKSWTLKYVDTDPPRGDGQLWGVQGGVPVHVIHTHEDKLYIENQLYKAYFTVYDICILYIMLNII